MTRSVKTKIKGINLRKIQIHLEGIGKKEGNAAKTISKLGKKKPPGGICEEKPRWTRASKARFWVLEIKAIIEIVYSEKGATIFL